MKTIEEIVSERILILDGAMGTMIQRCQLTETDFRGEEFKDHPVKLEGNNDLLVLTRPDVIADIHRQYLEAGADIIGTCTFNSQVVSQTEYQTTEYVRSLNLEGARIARKEADRMTVLTPDKPRFVAGSIGPTGKMTSMSPDMENPAYRAMDFDTLRLAYIEQIQALLEGGVDCLLIETIFDTLNAKAALTAAHDVFEQLGRKVPVMLSVTVADATGRMLAGQTLDAFLTSVCHTELFSVGLNCSFGAEQMLPFLKELSAIAPYYISVYPNAGLPNAMGQYDETPEKMAEQMGRFMKEGLVNIVGGCCGSTPEHIRVITEVASTIKNIRCPQDGKKLLPWLAGWDGFKANGSFINVGERCNVVGSRKFLRLVKEKNYDEALSIARVQVRDGAMILDINMDDSMLDAQEEMTHFLNLMASDPETARLPWMVDSSRFEVIEAALKCIQGKAIVNSLSLKEGEEIFLQRAARVRDLGAALVVMAFDEEGQATTYERKIEVCERAYRLLTEKLNFPPQDIIFDPNILTIATGMKEHDAYALDFIRATQWIHENLPHAKVSGGVSNLSFALRGNNYLREAMHAVFLYHAIYAGMDMAIVNPSAAVMYGDIPQELLDALEDVILCRREDATERLITLAEQYRNKPEEINLQVEVDRRTVPLEDRLATALQKGEEGFLQTDLEEALNIYPTPASIIEGPLMKGMTLVGELFGVGKMFLPQVVKTARTMKRAVEILQPHIEATKQVGMATNGKYLLATVKGDVHDIGKNIAGVVLGCNNFEVIDLGVMVPAKKIVETALEHQVDYIGLSGLITPSLDEMCHVACELRTAGISVPLFIGGATTSALHTAVKIAPLYDGPVFHVKDAAQNPILAMQLAGSQRERAIACLRYEQEQLRQEMQRKVNTSPSSQDTLGKRFPISWKDETMVQPSYKGVRTWENIEISEIRSYINWKHFYNLWGVCLGTSEAEDIQREADALLDAIQHKHHLCARVGFFEAYGTEDSIVVNHIVGCSCCGSVQKQTVIPTPRQSIPNTKGYYLSLCDYVAPQGMNDHIGAFAITVSPSFVEELEGLKQQGDSYNSLLMQSLGDRLVEAASEWVHERVRKTIWGYAPLEQLTLKEMFQAHYQGIRPAVGYPSLPNQKTMFLMDELIGLSSINIRLTENGAMYPQASVCGLYIANRHATYFMV